MSNRTRNIILILILMGITSVVSVLAYVYIVGGSGEASADISAPTLEASTTGTLFRIVPADSEARFTLTEELRSQPNTVVGVTNQVAGDIQIDTTDPANSTVGIIRINARTLSTDSEFRNRAIRAEVLESAKDEYEFIEFTPTAVTGLPDSMVLGSPINFQVTGDLTIRTITQSVTFDVTVVMVTDTRLEGTAKTDVTRDQFGLVIPNAPGVANVSNEVTLEVDFVATPAEG